MTARFGSGLPFSTFANEFVARTDYLDAIRLHTPGLVDEMRGIADGAGLEFAEIFAMNMLDEMWANGAVCPPQCLPRRDASCQRPGMSHWMSHWMSHARG